VPFCHVGDVASLAATRRDDLNNGLSTVTIWYGLVSAHFSEALNLLDQSCTLSEDRARSMCSCGGGVDEAHLDCGLCDPLPPMDSDVPAECFYVGERVECRDAPRGRAKHQKPWRLGTVTSISPVLEVTLDGWSEGFVWDETRRIWMKDSCSTPLDAKAITVPAGLENTVGALSTRLGASRDDVITALARSDWHGGLAERLLQTSGWSRLREEELAEMEEKRARRDRQKEMQWDGKGSAMQALAQLTLPCLREIYVTLEEAARQPILTEFAGLRVLRSWKVQHIGLYQTCLSSQKQAAALAAALGRDEVARWLQDRTLPDENRLLWYHGEWISGCHYSDTWKLVQRQVERWDGSRQAARRREERARSSPGSAA